MGDVDRDKILLLMSSGVFISPTFNFLKFYFGKFLPPLYRGGVFIWGGGEISQGLVFRFVWRGDWWGICRLGEVRGFVKVSYIDRGV